MTKQVITGEEKTIIKKDAKSRKGYSRKSTNETFWNQVRVQSGLTLKDVADLTEIKAGTVSAHFTGRFMPTDGDIKKYCKLFEVEFKEAKLQFENARSMFLNAHNKGPRKMTQIVKDMVSNHADKIVVEKEQPIVEEQSEVNTDYIIDMMYGKVSRVVWDRLRMILSKSENINRDDILDLVYNQVDVYVYLEIEKLI